MREILKNILAIVEMIVKLVAVCVGLFGAILIILEVIPVPSDKTVAVFAFLAFAGACLSMKTTGDSND